MGVLQFLKPGNIRTYLEQKDSFIWNIGEKKITLNKDIAIIILHMFDSEICRKKFKPLFLNKQLLAEVE